MIFLNRVFSERVKRNDIMSITDLKEISNWKLKNLASRELSFRRSNHGDE